ncbi:hypothetical protein LPB86_15790 [Pedobacter sp. MC2016-14]|uniref:hypothetical protein n=1 Tax=Pedobacter sp. MC2016-14 TaxID=2897327 RepID=UPI001E4C81BC|nr:hypothetical protein [Pedobacter sp. MC2016-14]MCD0489704.1 hypothetical protein [Pedobacter sp. MC2016-14]
MKVSMTTAHRKVRLVKKRFDKKHGDYITPAEFCEVLRLDMELVLQLLNKFGQE